MFKKFLSTLKDCRWAICASALLITTGLIFHWFYVLVAGTIVAISVVAYIICVLKYGDNDAYGGIGCLIAALFVIAAIFYHGERYISPHGHKQHLYSDCSTISDSTSLRKVTELEGFFYLTFRDCKKCKNRKRAEEARRRESDRQKAREELKKYLYSLIDSLDNGADPHDIEKQLQADWTPEDEGDYVIYEGDHKRI